MAKFSKRSRSKGNKRFDNTMVDDDFEELQRGYNYGRATGVLWACGRM